MAPSPAVRLVARWTAANKSCIDLQIAKSVFPHTIRMAHKFMVLS